MTGASAHDRGKPCHYYTNRYCVACYASPSIVVTGLAPVMLLTSKDRNTSEMSRTVMCACPCHITDL